MKFGPVAGALPFDRYDELRYDSELPTGRLKKSFTVDDHAIVRHGLRTYLVLQPIKMVW